MDRHPTRQELLRAVGSGGAGIEDHLQECKECRELFELFQAFPVAGRPRLPDAPAGWSARAAAIMGESKVSKLIKTVAAKLSFDSWSSLAPVGVRGTVAQDQRTMRFEAPGVVFDLRAERRSGQWDFVAQVQTEGNVPQMVAVVVDNSDVPIDSVGFYHWSSRRPPRSVSLCRENELIELPEIEWKRTRKN